MRTLLALALACSTANAAIFQNYYTTNSNPASSGNPINNFYVSNLFATNIYATNIYTTNLNVSSNLFVNYLFTVNGAHNTLYVTNSILTGTLKTNLLAVSSIGLLTNANYGTGISWDPATLTISSTGGSADTTATNIVTLTQTGTNISSLDYALVANGGTFKLQLTNNAYIGAPANVANTSFKKAWLVVQQPSTGTCALTFTNGFYQFPEGVAPIIDTNNGAVTVYQFISDPITNGLLHGWMSLKSKLIP